MVAARGVQVLRARGLLARARGVAARAGSSARHRQIHSGRPSQQSLAAAAVAEAEHLPMEVELRETRPPVVDTASELVRMNEAVEPLLDDPVAVLRWAVDEFQGRLAMSTSFGIQSAVLLHLATQVKPDIPVVWVDTGYLPEETYHYAQTLTETLGINLHVATNREWTPARMEAVHGKLWEAEDAESHALYGRLRKVQPMKEGLDALQPNPLALLSGLRASQTRARANMPPVGFQQGRFKLLPILRMSDEQVEEYMDMHDLPAHPLAAKGYVTVGDWHSSRPVQEGEDPRNTRFGGKFQECGLHVESHEDEAAAAAAANPLAAPKAQTEAAAPAEPEAEAVAVAEAAPLGPESLVKTGVKALGLTRVHPDTDLAVIMVKKLTEDGSFCRKCNDVAAKIETDNLADQIGHTAVANVLDHRSEGSIIAKHFGVATAPFFLVRDLAAERSNGEWKVVRSYLQLRKQLERAADAKIAAQQHAADADPELQKARERREALRRDLQKMQLDLRELQTELNQVERSVEARKKQLGE